jgi:hypothetical protein
MSRGHIFSKLSASRIGLVVALFVYATAALAQGDRGTLTGTVTDPQGSSSQAKISVKNSATAALFETVTTDTGNGRCLHERRSSMAFRHSIVNVASKKVSTLPGSVGLFSLPIGDPDGRYIAAVPLNQHELMMFMT